MVYGPPRRLRLNYATPEKKSVSFAPRAQQHPCCRSTWRRTIRYRPLCVVNLTGCNIIVSDGRRNVVCILEPSSEPAPSKGFTAVEDISIKCMTRRALGGFPSPSRIRFCIANGNGGPAMRREDVVTPGLRSSSAHLVADTYGGVQRLLRGGSISSGTRRGLATCLFRSAWTSDLLR